MSASSTDVRQLPFEWGYEASHVEDDFIEGEGNRLALAHVRSFPNWAGPLTLLEGPAKSGKSHLAQIWAQRASARVLKSHELEGAAQSGDRSPVIVEDVDRVGYDEDALFHLLNQAMRSERPVLMTARESVSRWPFVTDDVKSRARLAARYELAITDDIELSQMFVKLFRDRQLMVDPKVISYLVARMERSAEEVVALVELSDRIALSRGSAVTRPVAAAALAQRGIDDAEVELEGGDDE